MDHFGDTRLQWTPPYGLADEGETTKVQPEELKKNGFAMIKGNPCRLSEVTQLPKATANGNKRVQLIGLHEQTPCL